ncbi:hypothetical protein BJ742DRAFT_47875 [Cladochytrium replicatum]|nr:hypothetical protein BJ742DRAFT_47875 [Cladochytrium replicatum]
MVHFQIIKSIFPADPLHAAHPHRLPTPDPPSYPQTAIAVAVVPSTPRSSASASPARSCLRSSASCPSPRLGLPSASRYSNADKFAPIVAYAGRGDSRICQRRVLSTRFPTLNAGRRGVYAAGAATALVIVILAAAAAAGLSRVFRKGLLRNGVVAEVSWGCGQRAQVVQAHDLRGGVDAEQGDWVLATAAA